MLATDQLVDDAWIRKTWTSEEEDTRPKPPPTTPEAQLNQGVADVQAAIANLKTKIDALKVPSIGDGQPLVETTGLEAGVVTRMMADVLNVQMRLSVLQHIGETHAAEADTDLGDEDDSQEG